LKIIHWEKLELDQIIPDIMDVANAEKAKTIKTGIKSVMRQILL